MLRPAELMERAMETDHSVQLVSRTTPRFEPTEWVSGILFKDILIPGLNIGAARAQEEKAHLSSKIRRSFERKKKYLPLRRALRNALKEEMRLTLIDNPIDFLLVSLHYYQELHILPSTIILEELATLPPTQANEVYLIIQNYFPHILLAPNYEKYVKSAEQY